MRTVYIENERGLLAKRRKTLASSALVISARLSIVDRRS
uniref:Uncharacterized protein n=1 Tax=Cucumis melo TaxID=3656 RepID=A0A9I9ELT8_CUCME